jgi:hypothetical protein
MKIILYPFFINNKLDKMNLNKNIKLIGIIMTIAIIIVGSTATGLDSSFKDKNVTSTNMQKSTSTSNPETEYWALLFAVGIYKNHPEQNRESMLQEVEDLYDVLLDSPEWQADHIHKVTGSEATGARLISELRWLIQSEDSDDISLIYLTTHGAPLIGFRGTPLDLPPFDENDGADEILIMYEGFDKWYAFIWDDLLNFFISSLESQGVCVIVDSCYSGGFNDYPINSKNKLNGYSAESFSQGLMEELSSQGRVVLMSCQEYETSYGSHFSDYLFTGLGGLADVAGNFDGVNSAEEGFYFAKFWVEFLHTFTPTILDLYPRSSPASGELPLNTWI